MSKKNQQLLISGVTLLLGIALFWLLYLINDALEDKGNMAETGVLEEENISYLYSETFSHNHLSEIKDLYSDLEIEPVTVYDINLKESVEEKKPQEVVEQRLEKKLEKKLEKRKKSLPKLVIIIDDVAFSHQVKKLLGTNLNLTLSFFPADKNHPDTKNFAKKQDIYMLHLPLEAKNFYAEELDTLHVGDSKWRINKRISTILEDFPNLKYINNHTGSRFTSNRTSMKYLLQVLKEKNIKFVDSVTTSESVVKKVSSELGVKTVKRDIFLDNQLSVPYIHRQLRKAVSIAKKNGVAIAIGHPHKATIKALSTAENILSEVELVHINRVF
jgi:polysaccharide deacetylase 2 family uncharacterized protein YibQ